jgi:phosphatidylethanolamine-binding protein (PEBP) family uncharacterized protein
MPTPSVIPDPAVIHEATPTAVPELSQPTATTEEGEQAMPFAMNSRAFKHGESIPVRHSCDGEDVSPELLWTDPPTGTRSFALIMDDPDAPRGTHRYFFKLYALDRTLDLAAQASTADLEAAMQGHILAQAELMGTYAH